MVGSTSHRIAANKSIVPCIHEGKRMLATKIGKFFVRDIADAGDSVKMRDGTPIIPAGPVDILSTQAYRGRTGRNGNLRPVTATGGAVEDARATSDKVQYF